MRHPSLYRSARVRPLRSRHVGLRRMRVGAVGTLVPGSEPRAEGEGVRESRKLLNRCPNGACGASQPGEFTRYH
jgi:hypothetical protein